jgi:hypothetical protein
VAAVLAISVGAIHLAAVFHFTIIAHEVCAEHGELTHRAEASRGVPRQLPLNASAVSRGAAPALHDHCLPSMARERHALVPDASWSEAIGAGLDAARALSFETTCSRVQSDVLLVAPKQSPPCFCA